MTVSLSHLVAEADRVLRPDLFQDYCPNGLQVEGRSDVARLVTGVTACQALLERAIALEADAVLVHHGYFWRGEPAVVTGMKQRRLALLLQHGISLIAYHLPLDAHPEVGNNAQLARRLDIRPTGGLQRGAEHPIGNVGELVRPSTPAEFGAHVATRLARPPLVVPAGDHLIRTIAWCTGGAQGYLTQAAERGVDAFLTGEVSEPTVHEARELGVHFIAAGHHATERYGVQALGELLAQRFDIEHTFVDIDNPA